VYGSSNKTQRVRRYALQFDAAAFNDQFALALDVSEYFCFRSGGKSWRHTALPIGFRPACSVAQAAMMTLADVNVPGVSTFVYIDNVLFTGDDAACVLAAGAEFRRRCAAASVTVNESLPGPEEVFEFLGV
jgi:hypothetical protein